MCCRSVKLLDGEAEDNKHKAIRESWWQEIRHEIRTHAMSLGCNLVVGYTEDTSIFEEIVVLSANGTAVTAKLNYMLDLDPSGLFGPPYLSNVYKGTRINTAGGASEENADNKECSLLHLPGPSGEIQSFNWSKNKCKMCGTHRVPDVMFTVRHFEKDIQQSLALYE